MKKEAVELNRTSVMEIPEVEPWEQPVDGAALLDELESTVKRFVVLPNWAAETLALWIVHTYAFPLRDISSYLGVESPEKRCGKTTLLTVLSELVNRPVVAANISSSALFRVIEELQPTLMIDEADTLLQGNDELRGILNSGYTRKTAFVVRVASFSRCYPVRNPGKLEQEKTERTEEEGNLETSLLESTFVTDSAGKAAGKGGTALVRYSCWCPKVMAAIGRLPDTLADRCIVLRMARKVSSEQCERLKDLDGAMPRRKCARFAKDHGDEIAGARPTVPAGLNDRAADVWEPLLALADLAGGGWPEKARRAAMGLTAQAQESNPIGALLLHILVLFKKSGNDRLPSQTIVEGLARFGEPAWAELCRGKEINERWLAQQLRAYGVHSRALRLRDRVVKGYRHVDFGDVFRRYIPRSEVEALMAESRMVAEAEAEARAKAEAEAKAQAEAPNELQERLKA